MGNDCSCTCGDEAEHQPEFAMRGPHEQQTGRQPQRLSFRAPALPKMDSAIDDIELQHEIQ